MIKLKYLKLLILWPVIFSLPAFALSGAEIRAQMQQFQGQAMKAQACVQNVDRAALQKLQQEGEAMQAEVKSLCANKKREQAQEKAINYSKSMAARPEIIKIRECSKMMGGMMSQMMPGMGIPSLEEIESKSKTSHVCDEIN